MPTPRHDENRYLSITQLNQLLQSFLEEAFPLVQFRGEISEVSRPASGHIYFTIKDENAQISAVMWRGQAASLSFQVKPGIEVICKGRPTLYQKSGRLQIIVQLMSPAGEGLLQQKFFELKKKLGDEGLFSPGRKRVLPYFPKSIGVVTSRSGAVIHDIMVKIRERMPSLRVYLVDSRVQGDGAAGEIAEGIRLLDASGLVEVIIVARGGGSLEDLWAFNEEVVVRAIVASKVPVISGVGHEVDISLSDLAADMRAPTPTAAAEMVVPRADDLLQRVSRLCARLGETDRWLLPKGQTLDELSMRLERSMDNFLMRRKLLLERSQAKLQAIAPERLVQMLHERVHRALEKLSHAAFLNMETKQRHLQVLASKLEALSPRRVLERGYAVVRSKRGVVFSSEAIEKGDILDLTLHKGAARVSVLECEKKRDLSSNRERS